MIIRNLLDNYTATAGGSLTIGGIGAGIYRPIRLEQVGSVTSMALIFSRNGVAKAAATVTPIRGRDIGYVDDGSSHAEYKGEH